MTAQRIMEIQPVEIDGKHWVVSTSTDGLEMERRGPFPSADAAEAKAERRIQAILKKRIVSLGPLLLLKDDNDVFAHERQIRELGCHALIYSTWDYGFPKDGETKPSWGGIVVLILNRSWKPKEHPLIWDAANHLLGGGFDKHGRSTAMRYPTHACRSEDAPCRRMIIEGSALDADALIRFSRTLRPQVYGGRNE